MRHACVAWQASVQRDRICVKNGPVTESGSTPARFVEQTRVAAAAQLLKQTQWTQWTQDQVASRNSFGSVDAMRRAFSRLHGMTPQAHRAPGHLQQVSRPLGALQVRIDRTFALDDVVQAHRYLERAGHVGKVVLTT